MQRRKRTNSLLLYHFRRAVSSADVDGAGGEGGEGSLAGAVGVGEVGRRATH